MRDTGRTAAPRGALPAIVGNTKRSRFPSRGGPPFWWRVVFLWAGPLLLSVHASPFIACAIDSRAAKSFGTLAADEQQIAGLIQQLGDDQYAVRQRAGEQLRDVGVTAFDALLEACRHQDVEIALQARYLIRSMPISWALENDPPAVKNLLRHYDQTSHAERRNRMQQLARLENSEGIPAVIRLMRFETNGLLSKQAALCVMHHEPSTDSHQRSALARVILQRLGPSRRPAAGWIRAYAHTLEAPHSALAEWDQITRAELLAFAQFPQQTDRQLVRDLLRWQVDLLRRLGEEEDSLVVVRRTIDLLEGRREELYDFVDWLLDREAWVVVDEVSERFPHEFFRWPRLVYRLAEARELRGDHQSAAETAQRALLMDPGEPEKHILMASYLTTRLLYDWAESEYRHVLELTKPEDPTHLEARFFLSDMLFDVERERDAADVLAVAAETLEQNPKVGTRLPFTRTPQEVRGATHYYYAMHHARQGEHEKQREALRLAAEANPSNPDIIIAMYRCPSPDLDWTEDTARRIKTAKQRLRRQIESLEQQTQSNSLRRSGAAEALAQDYNELAWLISNTEGDLQAAIRLSQKSLELRQDNAAFLDTLARCHYAAGDLPNAIKSQRRAAELAPYYQQIHRQLKQFEKELAESAGIR